MTCPISCNKIELRSETKFSVNRNFAEYENFKSLEILFDQNVKF